MEPKIEGRCGSFYGVGVGPGDPELLTLKALRILNQCTVIAHPGKTHDSGVALGCVRPLLADFYKKQILSLEVPMTKDVAILQAAYEAHVEEIVSHLEAGEDVAFLNLGDPTIYGSYMQLHQLVKAQGFEAHIIPGIPSFCGAAAELEEALCRRREQLHIIPASYDMNKALELSGTKVFLKSASSYGALRELLQSYDGRVAVVCNATMDCQEIYWGVEEMPQDVGYLTLVFVYDK
ncbi:MAG: precorrin-2 C(20)-methyltransferase [Lachnospiraceae bacterium]|nr:precorrin-2 C(20)-methyltransferase [Lachnospiraceae bacterium]